MQVEGDTRHHLRSEDDPLEDRGEVLEQGVLRLHRKPEEPVEKLVHVVPVLCCEAMWFSWPSEPPLPHFQSEPNGKRAAGSRTCCLANLPVASLANTVERTDT